ncbi:hypothetical protein RO3G_14116 [Lichtheimia corymbifera JMRC:FSU:9682]|uniref:IRG-type G domain-containing protein n=1 Tax=Lichtheimia corymbifera JMRC:FSU:9682 TaxID=1263082 RepID=A0A068SA40_9FUNG|nr:hypothetical protein RO3G_14116 [Lichtheimia corymbifera JMRC:FSU:9682]
MGQTVSTAVPYKSNVFYDYEDFSSRFSKLTVSTLTIPMVIIAFPVLNAYIFTEDELTGVKLMDGMIGGLLGIVGWPLSPFYACWGLFQVLFRDEPPEPVAIDQELKDIAKREIGLNCERFYNVGVVGAAGTGKSSLINGILGYQDSDPRAAPTGETESTSKPKGYRHPDLRTMIVWDMPGAGTESHPSETYFNDKFLYAFDTLIIVIADRMLQIDIDIAMAAQKRRIPFMFVRNKADQAVEAKMRRYRKEHSSTPDTIVNQNEAEKVKAFKEDIRIWGKAVGELVEEVKHTICKHLRANRISKRRLFIISSWALQDYVKMLTEHSMEKDKLRLIHEERFLRQLVEGLLYKRRRTEKHRKKLSEQMKRRPKITPIQGQAEAKVLNQARISSELINTRQQST